MSLPEDKIAIGKILKPFGIKGWLKVEELTDFPERFNKTKSVFIYNEYSNSFRANLQTGNNVFEIEDAEILNKFVKLKLLNVEDCNTAESFRNCLICINDNEKQILPEGNYYYFDLIDSLAYNMGTVFGKVVSIENYGGDDLINVRKENGKEILVPFIDEFVKKIDVEKKMVFFELIDGFED